MGFLEKRVASSAKKKPTKLTISKLTNEEKEKYFTEYMVSIWQLRWKYFPDGSKQLEQCGDYKTNKDINEGFKDYISKLSV